MNREHRLPDKYEVVQEECLRLLERIEQLRNAYQDEEYRRYFSVAPRSERAAVKRASLDLSRALSAMRQPGD